MSGSCVCALTLDVQRADDGVEFGVDQLELIGHVVVVGALARTVVPIGAFWGVVVVFFEAVAAEDGLLSIWFEGNFATVTTLAARGRVHGWLSAISAEAATAK